jgi:hypothetical protein
MKDARGHGSNPKGYPKAERAMLNRQLDKRKTAPPGQRPFNSRWAQPEPVSQKLAGLGVSAEQIRAAVEQSGSHTTGIHQATAGKTLAETSGGGDGGGDGGGLPSSSHRRAKQMDNKLHGLIGRK